ncbi:MAG: division/cell wall cluster transcriptional repressor MraZ [Anaerolineaceae bacterium]|nr:division/cell wall cluster transcriptional repressor MraZ [Anaerolineaceae bacterium]
MFLGQYEHIIDEKGRMTIPSRFRELLADGAYITQGFDQNLIVLTTSSFNSIYERVNQMSVTDPNARQLRRLMFSRADHVDFDKAGRILIPQFLRQANCLENGAMVVGVGNYFEIWSPELWKRQNDLLQDAESNNQRFAALDLPL